MRIMKKLTNDEGWLQLLILLVNSVNIYYKLDQFHWFLLGNSLQCTRIITYMHPSKLNER